MQWNEVALGFRVFAVPEQGKIGAGARGNKAARQNFGLLCRAKTHPSKQNWFDHM
jgi:hypothetical protein